MILHEAAHFSFSFLDHFAFAPMGDGPDDPPYQTDTQGHVRSTKSYGQLDFLEALQKADCYTQCAMQMVFGEDFLKADQKRD